MRFARTLPLPHFLQRSRFYCSKDFCDDNGGIAHARQIRRPSRPILFGLTRHCWRRRVLDLDPTIAAAWSVRRPKAFRHDALAAELAGMLVNDSAVVFEMAIVRDAWSELGAAAPLG